MDELLLSPVVAEWTCTVEPMWRWALRGVHASWAAEHRKRPRWPFWLPFYRGFSCLPYLTTFWIDVAFSTSFAPFNWLHLNPPPRIGHKVVCPGGYYWIYSHWNTQFREGSRSFWNGSSSVDSALCWLKFGLLVSIVVYHYLFCTWGCLPSTVAMLLHLLRRILATFLRFLSRIL